ncbi:hypothetical protein FQN54_007527 [Arachnomyces sp. PD_36]|nr:hypothetical protein FQN54_007527 [Arachnomyces sp. PD_36]
MWLQVASRFHANIATVPSRVWNISNAISARVDDLLVRHERLVHPSENAANRGETRIPDSVEIPPAPSSVVPPPSRQNSQILDLPDPGSVQSGSSVPRADVPAVHSTPHPIIEPTQFNPSWGYDLNLLSHAASHVALEGQQEPLEPIRKPPAGPPPLPPPSDKPITDNYGVEPSLLDLGELGDPVQDFTVFLESVGLSSDWDSGVFSTIETEPMMSSMPFDAKPQLRDVGASQRFNGDLLSEQRAAADDVPSFSNFGSRLPSLQPEPRDSEESPGGLDDSSQTRPAWEVSNQDRQTFVSKLEEFAHVLPERFVPPSRHALSRFFAGYINGLNEHLPFIHVPSLSVSKCTPELSLALAAAGSHYRFENNRGIDLFHAAKAILLERIRRRDYKQTPQPGWNYCAPNSGVPTSRGSSAISNPTSSPFHQPYIPPLEPMINPPEDSDSQMEIIRTFLLLTVFASWERHPELLQEMLALQSTLARLVREHGLSEQGHSSDNPSWEDWSRQEGDRRTKLIVYCFFNLHSIMYNIPPLVLNSELKLNMPGPADEWKASSASQWRRLHRSRSHHEVSFQEAFARLFMKSSPSNTPTAISPLGNYVLIHAILQQIFFARQLCLSSPTMPGTSLRPEDLTVLDSSLSSWKTGWKRTPESSIDPQSPAGPIAFTSTALLGLAYIRLHLDLGPCRHLVTQNPAIIARALKDSPPLVRSPRLIMALLHSVHALSIPVRLGIDFVARTHSFFWSIQHSLCSLECAFLLSRWLLAIPATQNEQKLSEHERKLLLWVKSMIDETDMAIWSNAGSELEFLNDAYRVKQLSVAVVRVWSKTFKGNTSWPIVDLIGSSLEIYAELLDSECSFSG